MNTAERDSIVRTYVQRILEVGHPEAIILFGSTARHDAGPDSDVDILVIEDTTLPRTHRARRYELALRPRPVPVDIVVRTHEEVLQDLNAGMPFMVDVIREGEIVHGRIAYGSR